MREFTRLYPTHDITKKGCHLRQARRLLHALGFETVQRRLSKYQATLQPYLDAPIALAWFSGHMGLLRNGLLFEPDLTVWPLEVWLANHPKAPLLQVWEPLPEPEILDSL